MPFQIASSTGSGFCHDVHNTDCNANHLDSILVSETSSMWQHTWCIRHLLYNKNMTQLQGCSIAWLAWLMACCQQSSTEACSTSVFCPASHLATRKLLTLLYCWWFVRIIAMEIICVLIPQNLKVCNEDGVKPGGCMYSMSKQIRHCTF